MNKYASLACKVQLVDMNESPVIAVNTLKELIRTLMRCMEMPSSIRELGIDIEAYEEQLQNMTDNALMDNCLAGNPREAGTEAIKKILLSIY
jgi:1-propanol dehydrogenase